MNETYVLIGSGAEASVVLGMDRRLNLLDPRIVVLDAAEIGPVHCHQAVKEMVARYPNVEFGGKAFLWRGYGDKSAMFVRAVGDQGTWAKWVHWYTKWFDRRPQMYSPCGANVRSFEDSFWWQNGATIHDGVHIGPRASVGFGSLINTNAIIEHDVKIGEGVFVGPGAIILGGAQIGAWSFIGAGAIIAPNTKIHPHTFVKMGTRVTPASHPRSKRLVVDTDPAVADNVARPVEGGNDGRKL